MTGQYQHSIDAKGRVFIPAKLREELGETFYVTMGMDSCLSVYSDASWAKFTEKFESLPYTKTKAMRPLFANAAKCEPDSQGRILLPQKLRAYAGLDKDVVIIGVSNRAEIWNAERWAALEAEELNPENLAAVRRSWVLRWTRSTTATNRCCCTNVWTRSPSGRTAFTSTGR